SVGGEAIGMGKTFRTPEITKTTKFYVSQFFRGEGDLAHQANPGPVSQSDFNNDGGVEFDVSEAILLIDVKVYVTGSAGDVTIQLTDDKGAVQETTVAVPGGSESRPKAVTIPLNFEISDPSQGPFKLAKISGPSMLGTKSSDTNFPYAIGNSGEVTNGVSGSSLSESSTY